MAWFQLDPPGIADRASPRDTDPRRTSRAAFIQRGALGFCVVSVAGFVPWAFFGRTLGRAIGEAGLYAVCAMVFVALAGPLLHPLILGRGSLGRFYRLFGLAFTAYSIAWIAGWMLLRGHPGSIVGLLAGTALMGWILTRAFEAPDATLAVITTLFLTNTAGYFLGGWVEGWLMALRPLRILGVEFTRGTQVRTAMLAWGVFYGLGLGAGLGYAFHRCQAAARSRIATLSRPSEPTGSSTNPSPGAAQP